MQYDAELFNEAFEKNIVIVSTSTLLATLRTISSIWRQENQTRNAVEIARQAGDMYDKFEGFVHDLIKVGNQLNLAKKEYEGAMNKLSTGWESGKQGQKLKELGAKASKTLPQALVDRAGDLEDWFIIYNHSSFFCSFAAYESSHLSKAGKAHNF